MKWNFKTMKAILCMSLFIGAQVSFANTTGRINNWSTDGHNIKIQNEETGEFHNGIKPANLNPMHLNQRVQYDVTKVGTATNIRTLE